MRSVLVMCKTPSESEFPKQVLKMEKFEPQIHPRGYRMTWEIKDSLTQETKLVSLNISL